MTKPGRPARHDGNLPERAPPGVSMQHVLTYVPWWWTALTGLLGGAVTLGLGVWLTANELTPDPFAMVLITLGATGLSGVSARPHLERLAASASRGLLSSGRNDP